MKLIVTKIKLSCFIQYQYVKIDNAVLDPTHCDPKDFDLLNEIDNIIDNEEFCFYVDVTEYNFKLSLEPLQVAKIIYDKYEEKFLWIVCNIS